MKNTKIHLYTVKCDDKCNSCQRNHVDTKDYFTLNLNKIFQFEFHLYMTRIITNLCCDVEVYAQNNLMLNSFLILIMTLGWHFYDVLCGFMYYCYFGNLIQF